MIDVTPVVEMLGDNAHKLAGKRVLWSGTNGFLGRWVLRVIAQLNQKVLKQPCKLVAVDLTIPDLEERKEICSFDISYVAHNLTYRLEVPSLYEPFDYVVHMAGIASPHHYKKKPLETIDVAVEGSRGMLAIALRDKARYLFTSSSEVYQTASVVPTPEDYVGAIPSMTYRSCYDVSKLMGETLAHVYHTQHGVNTGAVRIFNSFGPGIPEGDHRILPRIASAVIRGHKLQVFGDGVLPKRTYCPTANTVAGVFLALLNGKPNEVYNIGVSSPEITVPQLIEKIEVATGITVDWEMAQSPDVYTTEPMRRCPDISKAVRELGYNPAVTLDAGLRVFFTWAAETYGKGAL